MEEQPGLDQLRARFYELQRDPRVSHDDFWRLACQLEELGDPYTAEAAFCHAGIYGDTADQRVAANARMCKAVARQGETQKAYEMLELAEDDLPEVSDEPTRELWESTRLALWNRLGGDFQVGEPPASEAVATFDSLAGELLDDATGVDPEKLRWSIEYVRQELAETPDDDLVHRHKTLTLLAQLSAGIGDGLRETEAALDEAASLEEVLGDERLTLERGRLQARFAVRGGDPDRGRRLFAEALPAADRLLEPAERITFAGNYLEGLFAGEGPPDKGRVHGLVDRIRRDLESFLRSQPGAAARRRVRELCQRALEAAVAALLRLAASDRGSPAAQESLERVWELLLTARNPELHWIAPEPPSSESRRERRRLEDEFHAVLCQQLLQGFNADPEQWRGPLEKVLEYELTMIRAAKEPGRLAKEPIPEAVEVIFFQIRDMLSHHPIVVLLRGEEEGIRFHTVADGEGELSERLRGWAAAFYPEEAGAAAGAYREVGRPEGVDAPEPETVASPPALQELVPAGPFLLSRIPRFLERSGDRPPPVPVDQHPWYLFPDDFLHALPVEMLPDNPALPHRFGQNRSVHLCLRPSPPAATRRKVDFSRGWLGVGEVPAVEQIGALPQSGAEVRKIAGLLGERGHPTQTLLGTEAHAGNLVRELRERRPAVLHVAAHGHASAERPDVCALILAERADHPERQLLPFRRIAELDLEGVDLVVLSACRSLLGRSGRSAGMEGLAWAFLQAGATQVVASRYRVDDRATRKLMTALYRHLLELPVADALGRLRDEALGPLGLDPREVGAWSVWC